tara:strand:- start:5893 stop:6090 length:198 start_codon:yes stop_codon:yes gene_type:complete
MEKMPEKKMKEMIVRLQLAMDDLEKFIERGNDSAGRRVRSTLNEARKDCQELRAIVQQIRNDRKV